MNKSWVLSHQMKLTTIFFTSIFLAVASADILQNSDFELPPSNWKENPNSPLFPLDANSTILRWTFEGAVEYAMVGEDLSLLRKGHAMLLGQDEKINQTFTAKGDTVQFLMTFTLAIVGQNCKSNASLVVSAPDSSAQFSFSGKYGKGLWEVYGHQIGSWGDGESINLVLQSQAIDADTNSTCWPVVDNLSLNTIGTLNQDKDLAQNRYFEDEAFIGYLKYLQYWQRPEYIKFIMYPHCLFFLELLQNPNFRNAMAHPANKELAHRQQFHFWKNHRNNRLKHILPKPLPEPTSAPSAVPPPTLPPATMITAAPAPPVPSSAANQVPSSMQYGGIGSGSVFVKNDPRNSGIDRRKRK